MLAANLIDRPDGRHELILERAFAHSVERVWQAVTDPDELSVWYPATVSIPNPEVGSEMALDYGDGWTTTAVITELEPPHLFAFTEHSLEEMAREDDSEIRIELASEGKACLMTFTQIFLDRPAAASYGAGWQGCFAVLDAVLDAAELPEDTTFIERHETLVAQFGLDLGEVISTESGWEIRFARQLMRQSIPKIWFGLTGGVVPIEGGSVPVSMVADGVVAGPIVAVEIESELSYAWLVDGVGAGSVRWSLSEGPGGGRIQLDQRGTPDTEARVLVMRTAWYDLIEQTVRQLNSTP